MDLILALGSLIPLGLAAVACGVDARDGFGGLARRDNAAESRPERRALATWDEARRAVVETAGPR